MGIEANEKILGILDGALKEEKSVVFGYLFGSFATGHVIPNSDVDIAVYLLPTQQQDFFALRLDLMKKCTQALKREVDIVILNTASPFLKYSILQEGILVIDKNPGQRISLELKAVNEYMDYQPVLQLYQERLKASV